jgi:hypothetical protein
MQQSDDRNNDSAQIEPSGDAEREATDRAQQDAARADPQRRESGEPGGGQGRVDVPGQSRVHPLSAGVDPNRNAEMRTQAEWGQGDRGPEGVNDSGGSELTMRDGQLLGGLTAGPSGEPTIDIHGKDRPPEQPPAASR